MTVSRRLSAGVAAVVLAGSLAGCGQDNPFGQIVREGTASSDASPSTADDPFTGFTTGPSESPEESHTSYGTGTPEETETMTETEDATASSSPASTPASTPASGTTSTTPPATGTSTSAPASTSRSSTATPEGSRVQVDGRTITGVPTGLGFPDGTKVSATNAFSDSGASVVMSAPAESVVFSYYRSALPGAGYRIVSDTDGTLAFTGHGYRGTLVGTGQGGVLTWAAQG